MPSAAHKTVNYTLYCTAEKVTHDISDRVHHIAVSFSWDGHSWTDNFGATNFLLELVPTKKLKYQRSDWKAAFAGVGRWLDLSNGHMRGQP